MAARARALLLLTAPLILSGCGYVHIGRNPPKPAPVMSDETLLKENSDLRLEKKMLQQELALTRAQGDALRMAIENRAADGDTSKRLVDQLNATNKELNELRTNYTRLLNDRTQALLSATDSVVLKTQLAAAEEKLATSLRNYTELQEEITRLKTEVATVRTENVALSEKVKVITAENVEAQAALAQLNVDLLAQKEARVRAEQDAETLRTELKSSANATPLAQQRTGAAADARTLVAEHAAETAALKEEVGNLRSTVSVLTAELSEMVKREDNALAKARLNRIDPVETPSAPISETARGGVNATLVASTTRPETPRIVISAQPQGAAGANGGRVHVVAAGDTLAKISTRYYGSADHWGDILTANRDVLGPNNNLVIGRTLRIPEDASVAVPATTPPRPRNP